MTDEGKGIGCAGAFLRKEGLVNVMKLHYVKANPSGNMTIIVLDPVEAEYRSRLANILLRPDCVGAEQVAYLTKKDENNLHIDMMGGEFCGNASRSAAAYALMLTGRMEGEYTVSCSGCSAELQAQAKKRSDGGYDAYIDMPLPSAVHAVIIDVNDMPRRFFRVELPGIVHFVCFASSADIAQKQLFWQAVLDYVSDEHLEAFGLDLFDPADLRMIPAVYVSLTDTLYWEQSCGSGSAAVAAALACVSKKNISCVLQQPGGKIEIAAVVGGDEQVLQNLYIGGLVTFEDMKEIDIPLSMLQA